MLTLVLLVAAQTLANPAPPTRWTAPADLEPWAILDEGAPDYEVLTEGAHQFLRVRPVPLIVTPGLWSGHPAVSISARRSDLTLRLRLGAADACVLGVVFQKLVEGDIREEQATMPELLPGDGAWHTVTLHLATVPAWLPREDIRGVFVSFYGARGACASPDDAPEGWYRKARYLDIAEIAFESPQ